MTTHISYLPGQAPEVAVVEISGFDQAVIRFDCSNLVTHIPASDYRQFAESLEQAAAAFRVLANRDKENLDRRFQASPCVHGSRANPPAFNGDGDFIEPGEPDDPAYTPEERAKNAVDWLGLVTGTEEVG